MPINPIRDPMNEFTDKYLARARAFMAEVQALQKQGFSPKEAVDIAWKRVRYGDVIKDATVEGMIKAAAIGAGSDMKIEAGSFNKDFILTEWVSMDKRKLSTVLYENEKEARAIITAELQTQIKLGRSYKYAAQFLQDDTGVIKATAPQYLDELARAGRRALSGDTEAIKELATQIKDIQRQIDRLSATGTTDRLKVNYQKLLDAVDSGNVAAMEKRLERAIFEKARYQAERVARTEIARAYGDARMAAIQTDEDCTGWQWSLSSAHKDYDICDFNAEADLHGMGPGIYPLDRGPEYPAHPNCTCIPDPFYKERDISKAVDNEAAIEHIQSLSDDEQYSLMGKAGTEQFNENPDSWRSALGYEGEVSKVPQIELL